MKPVQGYHLIKPEDLSWRPSNLMKIPNADYLERTGSHNLGARLWRLPPRSANTLPGVEVVAPRSPKGEMRQLVDVISSELKKTGATIVANPNWKCGIGTSIRTGIQHLIDTAPGVEATVLLTCDQPFVDRAVIDGLITLRHETRKPIVAANYAGTLGVPALFDRGHLPELLRLDDSAGAKSIILSNRDQVAEFPFPEGNFDIDTTQDWERFCSSKE